MSNICLWNSQIREVKRKRTETRNSHACLGKTESFFGINKPFLASKNFQFNENISISHCFYSDPQKQSNKISLWKYKFLQALSDTDGNTMQELFWNWIETNYKNN